MDEHHGAGCHQPFALMHVKRWRRDHAAESRIRAKYEPLTPLLELGYSASKILLIGSR